MLWMKEKTFVGPALLHLLKPMVHQQQSQLTPFPFPSPSPTTKPA